MVFLLTFVGGKAYIQDTIHRDYSVKGSIAYWSQVYGADAKLLTQMIKNESHFDPARKGDYLNGKPLAFGPAQYHEPTFEAHADMMGENLSYTSSDDQVKALAWVSVNKPKEMTAWTSYRCIKAGGVYKFHSKQLKKDFTIHCEV